LYQDRLDNKLGGKSVDIEQDWRKIKKTESEAAFEALGVQHGIKIKRLKIWNEELKQAVEQKKNLQ
jgi:hypothetical protein